MKCTNCGKEFPMGRFCPSCGTPAPETNGQNSLASNFEEQPIYKSEPAPATEPPVHTYRPPVTPVMPNKRKLPAAIVAVILAIVLIAGAVIGVMAFGAKGPADKIGKGVVKVLDSETFNFEMTVKDGRTNVHMTGTVEFIPKENILNFYLEATNKGTGEKVTMGIYDGETFTIEKDEDGDKWYSYGEVDEDAIEDFCTYYLEYSDSDLNKKKDVLPILEELDDLTDGELSEIVDLEVLAECIAEYVGEHNNTKWLKENAGFSQEKKSGVTYYTYKPNMYEFCAVSLPYFEEAFEDDDIYDEGMDVIKDSRSELKKMDVEITFGIKSGYLTTVLMDVEGIEMELTLSDFGKAELDYDELEDLLSEAEKGYKKQYESYYGYYD